MSQTREINRKYDREAKERKKTWTALPTYLVVKLSKERANEEGRKNARIKEKKRGKKERKKVKEESKKTISSVTENRIFSFVENNEKKIKKK